MTLQQIIENLKCYETPDAHIVVASTETGKRYEIEGHWCDEDGVINIIVTGRECGDISENLEAEVFPT